MMAKNVRRALLIVCLFGLWLTAGSKQIASAQSLEEAQQMAHDFATVAPLSIRMVDNALVLLAKGRSAMTPDEQAIFDLIFDPAATGQIDEAFVKEVLGKMQRIRCALESPLVVRYATDSRHCIDQQLYYTDLVSVTICPYFLSERDVVRKARGLVHEIAHMALLAVDRPYFAPGSEAYTSLTPRGGWSAQLPLLGRIIREVTRDDTLYHPDAYAHLSAAFSGIPGELALYQRFLPDLDGPGATATGHFVRYH